MTPQEAKEILQQIRKQKCVTECDCGCQLYELETFCLEEKALDMAIKSLEKEANIEKMRVDMRGEKNDKRRSQRDISDL